MKKRISLAILAIFILLATTTTVFACNSAVNYVSIDINPSIEIGVNMFDNVVSVEGTNLDGQNLVDGLDVDNMPVEEAVDVIMEEAADQGYIAEDGSTVVSVITETEDTALQEEVNNGVSLAMSNKKLIAPMYADSSSPEMRAEAKALGVSPGKYKLIKMLQAIDPTITVDQYKDAKVSEIIRKANELLIANGFEGKPDNDLEEITDNLEQVSDELDENEEQDVEEEEDEGVEQEDEDSGDDGVQNQEKVKSNNKNQIKVKHNKKSMLLYDNFYI